MDRFSCALLSSALMCVASAALRAETGAFAPPRPTLTNVRQVRQLTLAESEQGYEVRLRATVTAAARGSYYICFVQDATNGIFVELRRTDPLPSAGDEVEIEGFSHRGEFAPVVISKGVRVVGRKPLPAPRQLNLHEIRDGRHDSQWIEVSGVVRSAVIDEEGVLNLRVGSQHHAIDVCVPNPPAGFSPAAFVDAFVRLQGVCASKFDPQRRWFGALIFVPSIEQIRVERKPSIDPFALPVRTISSLLEFHSEGEPGHRVRVRGVATLPRPSYQSLFLQDETGSLYIRTGKDLAARAGDLVEVVGFPTTDGATPSLENAQVRVVGCGEQPKPLRLDGDRGPQLEWDARWASLTGTLVAHLNRYAQHRLVIRSNFAEGEGVQVFETFLSDGSDASKLQAIPIGATVRVEGICSVQASNGTPVGFRFFLRSADDVTVVETPPWWSLRHTAMVVAGMTLVVLSVLAWVVMLRRRVRKQTELIRERLEREANLEARYRDLFANATDVVFTTNLEGRITSINPAGERLVGYSSGDLAGSELASLAAPESLPVVAKIVGAQGPISEELHVVSASGETLQWDVGAIPIRAGSRVVGVEAIARDVTERRRHEDEVRQSQKMEAIGRLAGGVAHDFNNLLTVIIGGAEMLQVDESSGDGEIVRQIRKAGERAAGLTQQLLTFSRKQISCIERVDLNGVVLELQRMLARVIGEDVELKVQLASELKAIEADSRLIEQAVLNLAINARDAMPNGGTLTISTTSLPAEDWIRIEVRDTGCGIEESLLPHIFEPFFTTKQCGKGTGLGLASVYAAVQQFHGRVTVESEVGVGTVFRLEFPAAVDAPAVVRPRSDPPAGSSASGATLLLVEDNDGVRRFVGDVLRRHGCKVLEAANGEQAIEVHAGAGRVDLLVSDVVMPRMNGRELSERLHQIQPDLPVLFISGHTEDQVLRRGVLADEVHFLQKPFTPQRIVAKVCEVLEQSTAAVGG